MRVGLSTGQRDTVCRYLLMAGTARRAVGENLKRLREIRGWSQAELARRARMDRAHVARIEDGSYKSPRPENLEKLAQALNCDVDEITGREPIRSVTPYESNPTYRQLLDMLERLTEVDRSEIVRHAIWSASRLAADVGIAERPLILANNVISFPTRADGDGDFPPPPIAPDEWIEKDADRPRELHAWVRPVDAEAAAGPPRNPDDVIIPSAQLLNSLREVRDDRVKVVKIFGDSMHPVLRNGWKVLLDPARSLFSPGKIVMVYLKDEGTTVGLLAKHGDAFKIVKRNPNYGGPVEIPLKSGEWYPIGTITTIVEAPVEIE
jgi:transcriptional regulator with XRE-family HTH domain